jgi:hypothetical protein
VTTFFLGFVFGTLGIYVIKEGLRLNVIPKIAIGVALAVYPYFVDSPVVSLLVGSALFGASFLFR